ncbi:MAG: efflux RND transporter periplasmic adaptor subunit [Planctomycetales bacterium]|nr:efflux RND transporter periplasmic adaptor subunit [Planctomycetales bacterium]
MSDTRTAILRPSWLLAGLVAFATQQLAAQPPGIAPPVFVSPLVERDVAAGQTFVATVVPTRVATIGSAVDGRVAEFLINEGDLVEAKQPLAQLLTETISLERDAAAAELLLRQRELDELVAGSRQEEIAQAEAKMLAAEARSKYLVKRRERAERLFAINQAASEEDRDQAVAAALEAEENFRDAKAAFELAVAGPRAEQIAQAKARVSMQEALLQKLEDQIKKHTIITRFRGYVTAEHTEQGSWLKRGDPVAEIAALDEVDVLAYVLEKHVPFVRLGMEVRVEVNAMPDRIFTGTVESVVPQADVRARTFPIKIRVANQIDALGPLLKSGMSARVALPTGATQQALLVSKDAIVLGGPSPAIFVVDLDQANAAKGKVRPVPVQLGVASGGLIQVVGPLQPGQLVVRLGNERLRPGQDVTVTKTIEPEPASESPAGRTPSP